MNQLVPVDSAIHFGEIISPNSKIRVIGTTHPLNAVAGARIERHLDVGLTIEEMLQEALEDRPDIRTRRDFIVFIDGHPIEECNWRRVRAKAETTVTFMPRLQGGNALRTVLGVVVAVAALIIAPWAAGPELLALTGTAFTVGQALIAGGIVSAGPVALDALFHRWPDQIGKRLAPEASLDGMVGS
jgi:hypothetical protein